MKNDYVRFGSIALLTAGCATSCFAQSSVTLYGVVEEGITYANNVKGGSALLLQSGESAISRWGLKGKEDLGGGTKAIFVLENGFDASTGKLTNNDRLFGRQAYVGVQSDHYGTLTMGRQYEEIADMLARASSALPYGLYFAHAGDVDNTGGSVRINNSVKYTTPTMRGVTVSGLYGFGGQPGQFSSQSTSSAGVSYSMGPLYIAAAYLYMKNPLMAGFDGLTPPSVIYAPYMMSASSWRVIGAGMSYKIGAVTVGGVYTTTRLAQGLDGADVRFDNYDVNANWFLRPDLSVTATFEYTHGKVDATADAPNYRLVGLNLDYLLSKRTDVYIVGAYMKAAGSATQAAITFLPGPSSTQTQIAARVGLRHRF